MITLFFLLVTQKIMEKIKTAYWNSWILDFCIFSFLTVSQPKIRIKGWIGIFFHEKKITAYESKIEALLLIKIDGLNFALACCRGPSINYVAKRDRNTIFGHRPRDHLAKSDVFKNWNFKKKVAYQIRL